jgi:hypothetical protein
MNKRSVVEAFPDIDPDTYNKPDYEQLIESLGVRIKNALWFGHYSGDCFTLLEDDDKIGYLTFGYGSCSGCDALQRCDSIKEIEDLRDSLESSIKWFNSIEEFRDWVLVHDWQSEYIHYEADEILKIDVDESTNEQIGQRIFDVLMNEGATK